MNDGIRFFEGESDKNDKDADDDYSNDDIADDGYDKSDKKVENDDDDYDDDDYKDDDYDDDDDDDRDDYDKDDDDDDDDDDDGDYREDTDNIVDNSNRTTPAKKRNKRQTSAQQGKISTNITNFMAYGTRRFNATFTRALQ